MPANDLDLRSSRAVRARLGRAIGPTGHGILLAICLLALAGGLAAEVMGDHRTLSLLLGAVVTLLALPVVWWQEDLRDVPVSDDSLTGRLAGETLGRLKPGGELTAAGLRAATKASFQSSFVLNRLLIPHALFDQSLETAAPDAGEVLALATQLANDNHSRAVEPGHITAALILKTPAMAEYLRTQKLSDDAVFEVVGWLQRELDMMRRPKPSFGGLGRDWTFGFTPLLDRFGDNLSLGIAKYRVDFGRRAEAAEVRAIGNAFQNQARGIALVGKDGSGKTSAVLALAQQLIEGHGPDKLNYHQIIELSPSTILANVQGTSQLEHLMVELAHEVASAGHVVLFLDDAVLFTQNGTGSFDATQLLQQLIQGGRVPVIMGLMPGDLERLRIATPALANLLTVVHIDEPPEPESKRLIMDNVLPLESRQHVVVSYTAILEAYRLSGRYNPEAGYPGKAIKLLERAAGLASNGWVTPEYVQQAIEQTYGVKASTASPAEADALLHLEDLIHERMIDQTYAVKAVAGALRRARAGIANPNRPIGSFLFLGPTGVGKTELAKAVAAVYFNAESSMIRLDMSEYQQPDDVSRLLSGSQQDNSLLMRVSQTPFSVVLLDEIEKAHPNILNLLLQLLDEGQLTDTDGRKVSFKDCIIIATSNAGANTIREKVAAGADLADFRDAFVDELIASNQFKPELLNRFDELVLFGPLAMPDLLKIVGLMVNEINQTLKNQNLTIELTPAAMETIVQKGYDARLGARPMRRMLQHAVEDPISQKILQGQTQPGDKLTLDVGDLAL